MSDNRDRDVVLLAAAILNQPIPLNNDNLPHFGAENVIYLVAFE